MKSILVCLLSFALLFSFLNAKEETFLKNNLKKAQAGGYIVTAQNKNYTILHIFERTPATLTIEEITVPAQRMQGRFTSWKTWIKNKAPDNTSWVLYKLDLPTGKMLEYYSLTKKTWFDLSKANNFLTTLINLKFEKVPYKERRRIGLPPILGEDQRPFWQPRMVVDGNEISNVSFDAWQTSWPKDGSDLSGKSIEIYLPVDNNKYPSYFPYWLQISGIIGNAKVRIVDSGTHMESPAPLLDSIPKLR